MNTGSVTYNQGISIDFRVISPGAAECIAVVLRRQTDIASIFEKPIVFQVLFGAIEQCRAEIIQQT